jgi:hypothetical protein
MCGQWLNALLKYGFVTPTMAGGGVWPAFAYSRNTGSCIVKNGLRAGRPVVHHEHTANNPSCGTHSSAQHFIHRGQAKQALARGWDLPRSPPPRACL